MNPIPSLPPRKSVLCLDLEYARCLETVKKLNYTARFTEYSARHAQMQCTAFSLFLPGLREEYRRILDVFQRTNLLAQQRAEAMRAHCATLRRLSNAIGVMQSPAPSVCMTCGGMTRQRVRTFPICEACFGRAEQSSAHREAGATPDFGETSVAIMLPPSPSDAWQAARRSVASEPEVPRTLATEASDFVLGCLEGILAKTWRDLQRS